MGKIVKIWMEEKDWIIDALAYPIQQLYASGLDFDIKKETYKNTAVITQDIDEVQMALLEICKNVYDNAAWNILAKNGVPNSYRFNRLRKWNKNYPIKIICSNLSTTAKIKGK